MSVDVTAAGLRDNVIPTASIVSCRKRNATSACYDSGYSPVDTPTNIDALSRLDASEDRLQPFVERRHHPIVGARPATAVHPTGAHYRTEFVTTLEDITGRLVYRDVNRFAGDEVGALFGDGGSHETRWEECNCQERRELHGGGGLKGLGG
jgi:hypothetical protein